MNLDYSSKWVTGLAVGLLVTGTLLPRAWGELVYEEDAASSAESTKTQARTEDRATLRQVISTGEKAQATVQSQSRAPVPTQVIPVQNGAPAFQVYAQTQVQPAPLAQAGGSVGDPATEVQNSTKAELMRRERVREELKNEDILQERLEELRLRDEQRRTEQLLGVIPVQNVNSSAPVQAPVLSVPGTPNVNTPLQEVAVVPPITERPGQESSVAVAQIAPQAGGTQTISAATVQPVVGEPAAGRVVGEVTSSDRTMITLQPRVGVGGINGNAGFEVRPRYSAGINASVASSNHVSFELGYTYSEYGLALASTNPFVIQQQYYANQYGYAQPTYEAQAMKQNVVDAGLKLHFLGPEAKLRPFIGGGAAWSKSFINYDQRILAYFNQSPDPAIRAMASDYELNSYLGSLSTGLDVKLAKNISVGAVFKYYGVLSSRENHAIGYGGFYNGAYPGYGVGNPYGGGYYYPGYGVYPGTGVPGGADSDKRFTSGSLAKSSFYSIMAGVSFTF